MSSSNGPTPDPVKAVPRQKQKISLKRRGPKPYFKGSKATFLNDHLPAYIASKKGSRNNFWHQLYCDWWELYPWKLSDDEEPPTDDPDEMTRLAAVAPGEQDQKKQVERQLTERLTNWFINNSSATRRDSVPAWLPLLQQLHRSRNPRPRRRTNIQQFMQEYAGEVNAAFVSRHGDGRNMNNAEKMNLRHEAAKSLLFSRYPHLVKQLEEKAATQHQVDMEEWGLGLGDISAASDVSLARDTLFDAVHPLLEAIGNYAGCYVSLIAGNAEKDDDKGFFTAVHWWPGGLASTKDWTQWDEHAFNSGVAGPFLKYAGETDQLPRAAGAGPLTPVIQIAKVTPPLTLPNSMHIIDDVSSAEDPPSTRIGLATTTGHRSNYRPLPAKNTALISGHDTKKRKHIAKSRPIRYFEDTGSEEDDPDNFSGDGSSSGDSVSNDAPSDMKRQRTSRITTRSSARTLALSTGVRVGPSAASPAPALTAQLLPDIPNADIMDPADDLLTNTTTTSVSSPSPLPIEISAGAADAGGFLDRAVPRAKGGTSSNSGDTPFNAEIRDTRDTDVLPTVNAIVHLDTDVEIPLDTDVEVPPDTDAEVPSDTNAEVSVAANTVASLDTDTEVGAVADAEISAVINAEASAVAVINTEASTVVAINAEASAVAVADAEASKLVVKSTSSARSSVVTPTTTPYSPQTLADDIDLYTIPTFLRSHGKGKREVDIFDYLNKVEDARFRQVLLHYIRIEVNNKSGVGGLLPTAKRPVEISQWSARARPASPPDFTKGKRTFSDFISSVLAWWGSIQPSWRSFEYGKVSREVRGEWGTLYAPRINGLLNVVVLVYWWIRVLEEQEPEDGVRADYEQFADDVAWVLSNL